MDKAQSMAFELPERTAAVAPKIDNHDIDIYI
jgi:hypothetical protein